MRLFIAEKPSLARAIAEVLPQPRVRRDGYFECGSSDIVTWCAGHILELAAPGSLRPRIQGSGGSTTSRSRRGIGNSP